MDVQYRRCCGLDVHRDTVVACLLDVDAPAERRKQVRTFATTSEGLLALAAWLQAADCGHVAIEATGVYRKPVFNVLEGRVQVLVANAAHIKAVPGRKTDVKDAEWIAELLQHGLLRPSFIPDRFQRELRDLTRTRTTLIDERSAVVNRLHKVLEDANLKLSGVASDVLGVSGRAMLEAILAGTTDPAALADLARGRLRKKRQELERALTGRVTDHHRLLLTTHLAHIDFLNESIARLSAEIAERLRPFEADLARLDTIPGVGRPTAEVILAELGPDMTRFPTAAHAAAWAGICPGNYQSAGKSKGGRARRGSKFLRRALTEAAAAAARSKRGYLAARFRRRVVRLGYKKAVFAVGHTILVAAYHLLQRQEEYRDFDPALHDERRRARLQQRAVDQLHALGFDVLLTPKEQPAA
jgi:transposase